MKSMESFQNAQQVHNKSSDPSSGVQQKQGGKVAKLGKTDVRYWQKRVEKLTPREGYESPFYSVQVAHRGRRVRFPLETANKEAAAAKAQRIYLSLLALGWEGTLAAFKPQNAKPTKTATIGELFAEVKASAGLRIGTCTTYIQCLRQIASEIEGIGDQPALDENGEPKRDKKKRIIYLSRFDYRSGGSDAWIAKVDALPLVLLTADTVQRWKLAYIAKAGNAPDARRRAENSAASLIRNARSLFSDKALLYVRAKLILPDPLPFAGVKLPKKGNTRYQSKINAADLIDAANEELKGAPFQIFTLAMLCGLRRREIDLLTWPQIDFPASQIRLERTEYFEPKSEDSIGTVDVDPELLALLRGWRAKATGSFVIESTRTPRHETSRVNYRCEPSFEALNRWLRAKGVSANKPLHELRKELGALLASEQGIFAAQSVLRHAQISTTADYYADKKRTITAGLGALLKASPSNVTTVEFIAAQASTKADKRRQKA